MDGYDTAQVIHEGERFRVSRCYSQQDGRDVVIKTPRSAFPGDETLHTLRHEFGIGSRAPEGSAIEHLRLEPVGSGLVLVMEDGGAQTLADRIRPGGLPIGRFLRTAAALAGCLARLHRANVVHGSLEPAHVLLDPRDDSMRLCDFGSAFVLESGDSVLRHAGRNPAYVAPELTGRLTSSVDHRADLYALGVILYELLVGTAPFAGTQGSDLLHAHVARVPRSARVARPDVPKQVSDLLDALLEKRPSRRFHSAAAVRADLERCARRYETTGEVAEFPLRRRDVSSSLVFSDICYGRDEALRRLLTSFDEARGGRARLALVRGEPGVGKTMLATSLEIPVIERGAVFGVGKFDQFAGNVPYRAFIEGIRALLRQLLADSPAAVEAVRDRVLDAVAPDGQILVDVIPELEGLIGPQPPPLRLGPTESQRRFRRLSLAFLDALAPAERPLVLLLDDLQWADEASLYLIADLLADGRARHLLLLGTFRPSEVGEQHPLRALLHREDLAKAILRIDLDPLPAVEISRFVSDTLGASDDTSLPLAELLHERTGGNPFFLHEFARSIQTSGGFAFDAAEGAWKWDLDRIRSLGFGDSVADLLVARVRGLPADAQRALSLAATIGNRFDVDTLALVCRVTPSETETWLDAAARIGLIVRVRGESDGPRLFRFQHDRVQSAAYSLIDDDAREALHHDVGRLLLAREERSPRDIFQVLYQLNFGNGADAEVIAPGKLAELNRRAARLASESNAYAAALNYLERAFELLGDAPWETQIEEAIQIRSAYAEAAYLSGQYDRMRPAVEDVLEHAPALLDSIPVQRTRFLAFTARNQMFEGVISAIDVLAQLGVDLPRNPKLHHILTRLVATRFRLRKRTPESLLELPPMEDRSALAAMELMSGMVVPSFFCLPDLFPLVVFEMLRLSLQHGNCAWSVQAYCSYAIALVGALGDTKAGEAYSKLSLDLIERLDAPQMYAKALLARGTFVMPWTHHIRDSVDVLKRGYEYGVETGDLEYASINISTYCYLKFMAGEPLEEVADAFEQYTDDVIRCDMTHSIEEMRRGSQFIACLLGRSDDPARIVGPHYDEVEDMRVQTEANIRNSMCSLAFAQGYLAFLLRDLPRATERLALSSEHIDTLMGTSYAPAIRFFDGLVRLQNHDQLAPNKRGKNLRATRKGLRQLRKWAGITPVNFQHRVELLDAELDRVAGRTARAMTGYDRAIETARRNRHPHEYAMANEVAGRFYAGMGRTRAASAYLLEARQAYRAWGCRIKVEQLEGELVGLLGGSPVVAEAPPVSREARDLGDAVLRASRALSEETTLNQLLDLLMRTTIEHAGADRGVLVYDDGTGPKVHVEHLVGKGDRTPERPVPLAEAEALPLRVLQYVLRTGETAMISDAEGHADFRLDPYLRREILGSILCVPIEGHGAVRGALYLENSLAAGTFSQTRLRTVILLASQAAISIENARLYDGLEARIHERTQALENIERRLRDEKDRSESLLANILPRPIVEQLKAHGNAPPMMYESASIVFVDIVGFTAVAERLDPVVLVDELSAIFGMMDEVTEQRGLEKLRTIGDAYLAAGGLPSANATHAADCVLASLIIQSRMAELRRANAEIGRPQWRVRAGVHTGPVVAGVTEGKKFAYDIWGHTVNVASRLESSGKADRVNISARTYRAVRHLFECEERGRVAAKNVGEVEMYFVTRLRPEFSADDAGRVPNERFHQQREPPC